MCKSKAQGGQRCVGHATQRLAKAQDKKAEIESAFASGNATETQVAAARAANWSALVDYASTGAGATALREQWAAIGDRNDPNAKVLQGAIDDGALLAQANRRAENAYRASLDKGPLATPLPLTVAQQDQMDAAERGRAAAEAARNQDPLGLRVDQGAAAAPTESAAAPAAAPATPPTPEEKQAAAQKAREERAAAIQKARDERAAAAQQAREEAQRVRDEKAALVQAERAQRAQAARHAQQVRTAHSERAKLERTEARRLNEEATTEARRVKAWFNDVGAKQYSAPGNTWPGPSRWNPDGGAMDPASSKALVARAQKVAPVAFASASQRYAGEYSAQDIAEAVHALDAQACDRLTGKVRPRGWYASYETVDEDRVDATREDRYNAVIKDAEFERLRAGYVAANLGGVLRSARASRPVGSRASEMVRSARIRWAKSLVRRRARRAAMSG